MAIKREKKQELVQLYADWLENSQAVVFLSTRYLGVNDTTRLRTLAREKGARVVVIKNTLFLRALKEMGRPLPGFLNGPVSAVFCGEDIAAAAKIIEGFAKSVSEPAQFQVIGGLVGRDVLDAESARNLSNLPSREALFAQVLATIQAPASQLIGVVASGIRQVVNVLQARVDQLKESEAA
ncbi:MAG: 50S ribosomal protein L10 [Anaerolineae bacterium]|nr:50S ribosomal protein L10 [Anaerolineae bacterium]